MITACCSNTGICASAFVSACAAIFPNTFLSSSRNAALETCFRRSGRHRRTTRHHQEGGGRLNEILPSFPDPA